ncbi:patatin-like phospholipase family protein [Pontibacter sp. G13]|uniref:patatin-like phospholipase family protein n=1 Tax=Pontibacter sp. G13 TaxID=3074898 RepID=UPI00288A5B9D|nr:patatin-like phospholipase family protein [Pontibacter sp. G13]WNJ18466.1 patatin-like phospholipase family protein [Pontibacter sp. G13]
MSNENPVYKNLVFRGGGVKGIAYAGVLEALDAHGMYDSITRVGGTSAGAITSLLIGLRYEPKDIMEILSSTSFKDFMDKPNPLRIASKYGYYKGEFALEWLKEKVAKSPLNLTEDATFADLKAAGGRDTFLFATNVNRQTIEELSDRKTPNTQIAEAARASMSIPLFFDAFKFSVGELTEDLYVDGGMVYNYPMSVFDEPEFLPTGLQSTVNPETLGFYFKPAPGTPPTYHPFGYDHLIKFIANNFETILSAQVLDFHMDPSDVTRTVMVSDCHVKATDFDLTQAQQDALVKAGKDAVNEFLQTRTGTSKPVQA